LITKVLENFEETLDMTRETYHENPSPAANRHPEITADDHEHLTLAQLAYLEGEPRQSTWDQPWRPFHDYE
jgi:hypothetical protein